jgi:hypothetical protein
MNRLDYSFGTLYLAPRTLYLVPRTPHPAPCTTIMFIFTSENTNL